MGTNFYALINICPHCDRPEKELHIGKSSYGWTFSFHAVDKYEAPDGIGEIRSWNRWQEVLQKPNVAIKNEYGEQISYETFCKIVEEKRSNPENANHVTYCRQQGAKHLFGYGGDYLKTQFLDEDGNSFSEGEFC